jgi:hypothetical protein
MSHSLQGDGNLGASRGSAKKVLWLRREEASSAGCLES